MMNVKTLTMNGLEINITIEEQTNTLALKSNKD